GGGGPRAARAGRCHGAGGGVPLRRRRLGRRGWLAAAAAARAAACCSTQARAAAASSPGGSTSSPAGSSASTSAHCSTSGRVQTAEASARYTNASCRVAKRGGRTAPSAVRIEYPIKGTCCPSRHHRREGASTRKRAGWRRAIGLAEPRSADAEQREGVGGLLGRATPVVPRDHRLGRETTAADGAASVSSISIGTGPAAMPRTPGRLRARRPGSGSAVAPPGGGLLDPAPARLEDAGRRVLARLQVEVGDGRARQLGAPGRLGALHG